jgi:hypothetical protein
MKKTVFVLLAVALGAVAMTGCGSSEKEARIVLGKFEHVFQVCKEETEKQHLAPGKHACSQIASVALDSMLRDTGVGEGKLGEMRGVWLERTGYRELYVPEEQR